MASLELQAVHKAFGEVVALKSLDLSVKTGEFVSLLGPSGCGKTTALRIIAGFERASSGRVTVDGKDITNVPANKRDMGMVFQAYSLFPNMTAQQNIEFGLRLRGKDRRERAKRSLELLDLVGLSSAAGRYPHQLSGGQQQRVALARALAIEPSVLLLDEPLSALDAKVRVQLRDEIHRIQAQLGITTLYVTHDQEEALSVSDRVVVLSQGQIEQVGTPAEIYGDPHTVFVAEFIGTMNRLEGQVVDGAKPGVNCGGVTLPVTAAAAHKPGESVLVLVRPEALELEPLGDEPTGDALDGHVVSHTFLGPVTRLTLDTRAGTVQVDVPSVRALSLSSGTRVRLSWDPTVPRLISIATSTGAPSMEASELQRA